MFARLASARRKRPAYVELRILSYRTNAFSWANEARKADEVIDLNPDTVVHVAELVREFQTYASLDAGEPPESPLGEAAVEQLAEWSNDTTYQELKNALDDLEPDQQVTLVALMWLGRGDYSIEEWDEALEYATEVGGANTAEYLIATPLLADYLQEALNQHGYPED